MTKGEFSGYLLFVAIAMATLGVVNLLRPNKRWLGVSAILWGAAAILYREGQSMTIVGIPSAFALLCVGLQARNFEGRKA